MPVIEPSNVPVRDLLSLQNRSAVITGGAKGLGRAIGQRLFEAGATVSLADIDKAAVGETAAAIGRSGNGRIRGLHVDMADPGSITDLARRANDDAGGIDIWVNNAGIFPTAPLLELDFESWDRVHAINLRGVFLGAREAARHMIATGSGGVIVNIASTAAFRGTSPQTAAYVSSKHGVRGLTRQMALELAPHAIRVLGVAPSFIPTEGTLDKVGDRTEVADLFHGVLGRPGTPDDVARVVLFCVSDAAAFMTGSTLLADGGDLS